MSLPSEGQSLSGNQISSTYLNSQLRYNYFRFGKQTSAILEFSYRFRFRLYLCNRQSACYFASGCPISFRSDHILRKYDVITILQDGNRGYSVLLPVSYLLLSLPSEGQNLSVIQISSTYLIHGWDMTTFALAKQTSAILEFYFGFDFDHFTVSRVILCTKLLNVIHVKTLSA